MLFLAMTPPTAPPTIAAMRSTIRTTISQNTFTPTPYTFLSFFFAPPSPSPFSTTSPSPSLSLSLSLLVTVADLSTLGVLGSSAASPIACGAVVSITWGASRHLPWPS